MKDKDRKKNLVERDCKLLQFCYEQNFLSRGQVMEWLRVKSEISNLKSLDIVARRMIHFLLRQGWIRVDQSILLKCRELYCVTRSGMKMLKMWSKIEKLGQDVGVDRSKIYHDYMATQVRLTIEEMIKLDPWYFQWKSERLLKTGNDDRIPDAELILPSSDPRKCDHIAIEIEISQKSQERYIKKFRNYEDDKHFKRVFYFVPTKQLKGKILEYSQLYSSKIFVGLIDELLRRKQF